MNSKILKGTDIILSSEGELESDVGSLACRVRKGHTVCGDSAFIHADPHKVLFGVFDGVSGEAGADMASSQAARMLLNELGGLKTVNKKQIKDAFSKAHASITDGFTTALVVFVSSEGYFLAASVGDCTLYSIDKNGKLDLELGESRIVGKDDTIFRYLAFRNIVKSVMGWSSGGMEMEMIEGKLSEGEILIAASDAVKDNLKLKVSEYNVEDASGLGDLQKIMGSSGSVRTILEKIYETIIDRMGRSKKKRGGYLLAPKKDDLSLIVFKFSKKR